MQVYDKGRRFFTRHFIVFALPRGAESTWRLGLAITKKIGGAVRRNRVKRVLREFFRLNQHELRVPCDIVVVARRGLDPERVDLQMVAGELTPVVKRLQSMGHEDTMKPAQRRSQ